MRTADSTFRSGLAWAESVNDVTGGGASGGAAGAAAGAAQDGPQGRME